MRATVEFSIESQGTPEKIYETAQAEWKRIVKDSSATLPSSAEMNIAYNGTSATATVIVRTKVGEE